MSTMTALGFSFSPKYCELLGLDSEMVLDRLLALKPKLIRISAYWNDLQPTADSFDFTALDHLVDKLRSAGVAIMMTVGLKAQRWPEVYPPTWLAQKFQTHLEFRDALQSGESNEVQVLLLEFIRQIVTRYVDRVERWQLENEPLQPAFPLNINIGRKLLVDELAVMRGHAITPIFTEFRRMSFFSRMLAQIFRITDDSLAGFEAQVALNIYHNLNLRARFASIHLSNSGILQPQGAIGVAELQAEPWPMPAHDPLAYQTQIWKCIQADDERSLRAIAKELNVFTLTSVENPAELMQESWRIVKADTINWEFILWWGAEYWVYREVLGDPSWVAAYNSLMVSSG